MSTSKARRGSALLAVLWLSAALAAIAFSLANTVRGETDRAATLSDSVRAYYLAAGAVQRATLRFMWQASGLDSGAPKVLTGHTKLEFPEGAADVEVIPEVSKLNINTEQPEVLFRLLIALGQDQGAAREIALAIEDWRKPSSGGEFSAFDQFYLAQSPSFRARHASFEETEELLQVKGVTPELYYGTWVSNSNAGSSAGRLVARHGLIHCVSVWGSQSVDLNTSAPEVMEALGMPRDVAYSVMERRRGSAITPQDMGPVMAAAGPAAGRLQVGMNGTIFTIRATARVRLANGQLSDVSRTVAALVKYMPQGYNSPIHILRWYDTTWTN